MNYKGVKDQMFTCAHCAKTFQWVGYGQEHKFCSVTCTGLFRQAKWLVENEEKFKNGTLPSRAAIKRYIRLRDGDQCALCPQQAEHNGKPLTMILDHIDGDASHNLPCNFRLLCPNCDSQQPTFKGANRGNGRATKGMKWNSQV